MKCKWIVRLRRVLHSSSAWVAVLIEYRTHTLGRINSSSGGSTAAPEISVFHRLPLVKGTNPPRLAVCPGVITLQGRFPPPPPVPGGDEAEVPPQPANNIVGSKLETKQKANNESDSLREEGWGNIASRFCATPQECKRDRSAMSGRPVQQPIPMINSGGDHRPKLACAGVLATNQNAGSITLPAFIPTYPSVTAV
jgi:hypothetical protein